MRVLEARIPMQDTIIDALRQGNAAQALPLAREWASNEPGNAQAHRLLAAALRLAGEQEAALESIDQAISLAPDEANLYLERAGLLMNARKLDEAQVELARSTGLDPNLFASYLAQAQLALLRGQPDEAERLSRLAGRVSPGHPQLASIDGMVALQRNDVDRAIGIVSYALGQTPDDEQLRYVLGFAYMGKQLWAFAEQALKPLAETAVHARNLRPLVADLIARQGRHREAAEWLKPLLENPATATSALRRMAGQLHLSSGDPEQARPLLLAALAEQPDDQATLNTLLTYWRQQGQQEQARQTLEAALATAGEETPNLWLARLSVEEVGSEEAFRIVERWVGSYPQSLPALEARMAAYTHRHNTDEAEKVARQILGLMPGHIGALATELGALQARNPQAAVERVEALLTEESLTEPAQDILLNWLARAQDHAGLPAEAAANWIAIAARHAPSSRPLPPLGPLAPPSEPGLPPTSTANHQASTADAIFLWGLPGSGVERIAELLSVFTAFRNDRFGPQPPNDGFQDFSSVENLSTGKLGGALMVQEWLRGLPTRGINDSRVIDWLPWWDNTFLHALRPHMPNGILLVVVRDPRDMLLEWLAFGSPARIGMTSPLHAAQWMAAQIEQILTISRDALYPHALIRIDGMENDPIALTETLKTTTGLQPPIPQQGMPVFFKSGHWRNYAEALAEPFAILTPVAVALGYPET